MVFISSDPFLILHTSIGYFIATIGLRVIKKNKLVVNLKCNQTIINEEEVDTFLAYTGYGKMTHISYIIFL